MKAARMAAQGFHINPPHKMSIDESTSPIVVEFEEDIRKSHELGIISSRRAETQVAVIRPDAPVFTEAESIIKGSYFSAEFTTVHPVEDSKILIILRFQCHPAIGHRFASAKITVKFASSPSDSPETPSNESVPRVVLHAPRRSYGGCTKEDRRIKWGLALPIRGGSSSGVASASIEPSYEHEVTAVVDHALTFTGTARGAPVRTSCVWTVEENKSTATGIPTEFQVAVVLEHVGAFVTELDVQADIRGMLTRGVVRSKKGPGAKRMVKVEDWASRGFELNSGQDWKSFVEGLTGEVPGSMVVFPQAMVAN